MLKRLFLSLAFAGLLSPALASGTIPLSMSQQFDTLGKPLSGCKLYIIQAGTTSTPQNAYQDSALTVAHPNPLTCDSAGRLPQFFLADGSIKVRLADKNGVNQTFPGGGPGGLDNILVIGPSGGGGGGGTIDATTIFQTGDVMWLDVDAVRTGWVRDNGRSIGNAVSGASERAAADTAALFAFLWATYNNTICPVSSGRGVSAAADFAAGKTIATPNKQGLIAGGLDGMGATATNIWASIPVISGSVTTSGSIIGSTLSTLLTANLPPYTPSGTNAASFISGATTRSDVLIGTLAPPSNSTGGANGTITGSSFAAITVGINGTADGQIFFGNAQGGSSTPLGNVPRTVLGTFYRKL